MDIISPISVELDPERNKPSGQGPHSLKPAHHLCATSEPNMQPQAGGSPRSDLLILKHDIASTAAASRARRNMWQLPGRPRKDEDSWGMKVTWDGRDRR